MLLSYVLPVEAGNRVPYAELVNTMIGTKGAGWASGYTYPGATCPFGMVQFTRSYFCPHLGFGINQLSGAGCDHMGNFPMLPLAGELTVSPGNLKGLRLEVSQEKGIAGYYQACVNKSTQVELSVTERTGMARLVFSGNENKNTVIIAGGVAGTPIEVASVVITGKNTCEGYAEGGSFCGISTPYKVYFVAEFNKPCIESGIWKEDDIYKGQTFSEGKNSGVFFTFAGTDSLLLYKIGISYVSVANARENLKAENNEWDFDKIKMAAIDKWNFYLGKIEADSDNDDRLTQFYTHLYHALIHPNICSDVNGDYMGADNKIYRTRNKQYTSFSNWDTYRGQTQLLAMLAPDVCSDVVASHYDFAMQGGGGWPRWVMANIETGVMQGDPTTLVVANAYAFGARNYDPRTLLSVMKRGAEKPDTQSQNEYTRPGLKQYLEKGYYDASIHLEYTSADFAIAQFALHACNNEPTSWHYMKRADFWRNLYNPETGWLQSRNPDGSWKPLNKDFRESTYKNYFWMVPYNYKGLIDIIGGKQEAEKRLDEMFVRLDASYNDPWYAAGNEPSFGIPWVYNWVGKPWKTQGIIRRILNEQYFSTDNGLPGNDDLGSMGAWYVFACLGIYPEIPAVGGFSIHSPIFKSVTLHLENADVVIEGGSEKNEYVQSLHWNGKEYDSTWIDWNTFSKGGGLKFKLGSRPNEVWGTKIAPPSFQ